MRLRILVLWAAFSGLLVAGGHANEATIAAGADLIFNGSGVIVPYFIATVPEIDPATVRVLYLRIPAISSVTRFSEVAAVMNTYSACRPPDCVASNTQAAAS